MVLRCKNDQRAEASEATPWTLGKREDYSIPQTLRLKRLASPAGYTCFASRLANFARRFALPLLLSMRRA